MAQPPGLVAACPVARERVLLELVDRGAPELPAAAPLAAQQMVADESGTIGGLDVRWRLEILEARARVGHDDRGAHHEYRDGARRRRGRPGATAGDAPPRPWTRARTRRPRPRRRGAGAAPRSCPGSPPPPSRSARRGTRSAPRARRRRPRWRLPRWRVPRARAAPARPARRRRAHRTRRRSHRRATTSRRGPLPTAGSASGGQPSDQRPPRRHGRPQEQRNADSEQDAERVPVPERVGEAYLGAR